MKRKVMLALGAAAAILVIVAIERKTAFFSGVFTKIGLGSVVS